MEIASYFSVVIGDIKANIVKVFLEKNLFVCGIL